MNRLGTIFSLVSFFSASILHAQEISSGSVRLALIEDVGNQFSDYEITSPLVHLLSQHPTQGSVLKMEFLSGYYSGQDYRILIPASSTLQFHQTQAVVLKTESVSAIMVPPVPSLITQLLQAASNPASFEEPWSVRLATQAVTLSTAATLTGETMVTALADPALGESARWHSAFAAAIHLNWEGQDVSFFLIGKPFGGLDRLAAALKKERTSGVPLIGLARSHIIGDPLSPLKGAALTRALEKLGLSYSAVSSAEIFDWKELVDYRRKNPKGVQLLSANLVYSSAPAVNFLPDHAIVEAGGLKVAITAVTAPTAARYLAHAGLGRLSINDPVESLRSRLPKFRAQADLVVLLCDNRAIETALRTRTPGIDLIVAQDARWSAHPADTGLQQHGRRLFEPPMAVVTVWPMALNVTEVSVERRAGLRDIRQENRAVLLDESVPQDDSFSEFSPEEYGLGLSTEPALIPAAQDLFSLTSSQLQTITSRYFWTMAASLLVEQTGSEIGLLRAWPLGTNTAVAIKENLLRVWLRYDDQVVRVLLKGSQIKALLEESKSWDDDTMGISGRPAFVMGGLSPASTTTLHGLPLDPNENYQVVTSLNLAEILNLPVEPESAPAGRSLEDSVLTALRKHQGSPPQKYRDWMQGSPVAGKGLWRINFRDVSLNLQDSQVQRSDAFNSVSNPRIQGSDELLVGATIKTDADYLLDTFKWGNTLELDYARSRLHPRDQPPVTNVTNNRASVTSGGTQRAGVVEIPWLARSWGPSLALNYTGQLEATPPLRRQQVYSLYPGIELYDGSWIRTLRIAANFKRDYSVDPVDTQYGFRARALISRDIGPGPAKLDAEAWANYFFLTAHDQPQDLRWESDVNVKLRIPLSKCLMVAPFVDFYSFALKTQPRWGYSAMTGISIGFSRLWKPQYEGF